MSCSVVDGCYRCEFDDLVVFDPNSYDFSQIRQLEEPLELGSEYWLDTFWRGFDCREEEVEEVRRNATHMCIEAIDPKVIGIKDLPPGDLVSRYSFYNIPD